MPPKQKLPAPIDRPLSRAYLREFSGWSTAYPPGLSEPTSLRVMENTMINRDGSLRIRPGLKYLSYSAALGMAAGLKLVGGHEVFFLADGSKAYLFAVRELNGTVGFRAAKYTEGLAGYNGKPFQVLTLNDALIGFSAPGGIVVTPFTSATTYVKYLQIDNKILALSNAGESMRIFYVGTTKFALTVTSITSPAWTVADKPVVKHPKGESVANPVTYPPLTNNTGGVETAPMLRGSGAYSVSYFYTFSNAIGESAASQMTVIQTRRAWGGWKWETSNIYRAYQAAVAYSAGPPVVEASPEVTALVSGEPSGIETDNPALVADQIAIYPSQAAFNSAVAAGAAQLNVYAVMWNNQTPMPPEGELIGIKTLTPGLVYADAWVRHSPAPYDSSRLAMIPTVFNRRNYSESPKAGQGIVAADRMVLVNDPTAAAVIRWSSNRMGENTNFTAAMGGGYKTLTSGNLFIPACVKLWQNPQSTDTLCVLCLGVDGYSASYYMAPAQIASQSDAVNIMGFEETTATPGTSSPFGVEVHNNALYHPLETELMKSTASNYNINHKTMTELVANMWGSLLTKDKIVSSQLDNRLYYIVNNRYGAALEDGCWGNEIWVFDAATETGTWSRWLVQSQSLRKIEVGGRVVMSVVRPEGFYCFDDTLGVDEYVDAIPRTVLQRSIPWKVETNTQGANRAHDAWAHLQQVAVVLGNFQGTMRFGIRGYDVNGKAIDVSKLIKDNNAPLTDGLLFDLEDFLLVRRDMKEWRLYAESVLNGATVLQSSGQISLVQYRYAPVSVNVGYEYGSVETFEYKRNAAVGNNTISTNGVPNPMTDIRRP